MPKKEANFDITYLMSQVTQRGREVTNQTLYGIASTEPGQNESGAVHGMISDLIGNQNNQKLLMQSHSKDRGFLTGFLVYLAEEHPNIAIPTVSQCVDKISYIHDLDGYDRAAEYREELGTTLKDLLGRLESRRVEAIERKKAAPPSAAPEKPSPKPEKPAAENAKPAEKKASLKGGKGSSFCSIS